MPCLFNCTETLKDMGMRPTRQRMGLLKLLFAGEGHRHVTAEGLHAEANEAGIKTSLATVYNTLNQLTRSGKLREITINSGCTWYDTNTSDHYHFLIEGCCQLIDIDPADLPLGALPALPKGTSLDHVDVVLHLRRHQE